MARKPRNLLWLRQKLNRGYRERRMQAFVREFLKGRDLKVLDLGGDWYNWSFLKRGHAPVIVNVYLPTKQSAGMRWLVADGRRLPFRDGAFDVVFSNAVIEHVGRFDKQRLFAQECRRVGRSYFVTTPNRGFFIEPHLLTPFVHWLPRRMLTRNLLRYGTLWGLMRNPPVEELDDYTQNIWLLDERQMRHLFPDAEIRRERLMGMTKTLIAAKTENGRRGERSRQEGGEHISA